MTDSVVLPNGQIMHKVYGYQFEYKDKKVFVGFCNFGDYEYTGADHSFSSELRRSFGQMLLEQPPAPARNMWLPLPEHEYLDKLRGNGFNYVEYHICDLVASNRMHISVKAETVNPPVVFSDVFRRPMN